MTESQLTEKDRADLAAMGIDADESDEGTKRSILEIWHEVLKSVEAVAAEPIPAIVAHKVVASWPRLSYQDTAVYHEHYHTLLLELREPLAAMLKKHPEIVGFTGPDDAEENRQHYIDIMVEWNLMLDDREAAWRAEAPDSHIVIAALIDARAFIFSATGLVGHLSSIGLQLENDEFLEALEKAKEER